MLQTVVVSAGKEDPAYTIMRKAIEKQNTTFNNWIATPPSVYKGKGKN